MSSQCTPYCSLWPLHSHHGHQPKQSFQVRPECEQFLAELPKSLFVLSNESACFSGMYEALEGRWHEVRRMLSLWRLHPLYTLHLFAFSSVGFKFLACSAMLWSVWRKAPRVAFESFGKSPSQVSNLLQLSPWKKIHIRSQVFSPAKQKLKLEYFWFQVKLLGSQDSM